MIRPSPPAPPVADASSSSGSPPPHAVSARALTRASARVVLRRRFIRRSYLSRGLGEARRDHRPLHQRHHDIYQQGQQRDQDCSAVHLVILPVGLAVDQEDRKSTRLNSSHVKSSRAVFCST